jgi:hypothetical protein
LEVQAVNTQKVRFLLSPTGTDTSARLLGEDTNGSDGWTLAWGYPDEPLTAHLTVKAIGPGGTSPDTVLDLYHPDHQLTPPQEHAQTVTNERLVWTGPGARRGRQPSETASAGSSPRQPRRLHARRLRPGRSPATCGCAALGRLYSASYRLGT